MNRVGIAIPVFNEEAYITRLLESFLSQTVSEKQFFIVVADNGSTDKTMEVIHAFKHAHKNIVVEVIQEKSRGVLFARKRALDTAVDLGANILMTTDADCIVGPEFVAEAIERLEHNKTSLLLGHARFPPKFRLLVSLYFSDIVTLERKLYALETRLFGPIAYGSHMALNSELYTSLYFEDMPSPLIAQDDLLISRRCFYKGASFIQARTQVTTSDRRFWGDISEWVARTRLKEFRDSKDKNSFTPLTQKQIISAQNARVHVETERMLASVVDALFVAGLPRLEHMRAKRSLIKALRYFHLPVSYVLPIALNERANYLANFTTLYRTAVHQKLESYVKK